MSKKNTRKTRAARQKERLKVIEEIANTNNEISECEKKITDQKKKIIKEFHIRNLKVFGGTCNLLLPFVVVGGIIVGGFKVCNGGLPFYRDDITKYHKYELDYETNKEIKGEDEYVRDEWWSDELPSSFLTLYTPWEEEKDSYARYRREYSLPDDCYKDLYDAIFSKDFDYIDENYEIDTEEKEVSSGIYSDFNDYIVDTELYNIDRDDFIKYPETKMKNYIITVVELLITLGLGCLITKVRDFDYLDYLSEANIDYSNEKKRLEELLQELEEKKQKVLKLNRQIGRD